MSAKFIRRTLRNVVVRDHPYFAHLALTHKCNLRCRFCHIQEERFEELDTDGMKRVIDVLDEMGVGVLSVSGGGEPLLRRDVTTILNYAHSKGMYTKITSNGTMPPERYQQLLESSIKEISISLDGVDGNDLPFSHVGPKILDTIRYLHDHLPEGKQLTLNVTVTAANRDQVDRIVAYCAAEFPHAKVWLNPVVIGSGKLRTSRESKANPEYLRTCNSPTLLKADFYTAGVEKQYLGEKFDWGCRAGRMFFDIKPNGDYWLCQDKAAGTPLNLLDPDFRQKLRHADFSHRRQCSGCTYSCYYLTQNGLELRNWPQVAGMWWKANTRPGEHCRVVAEQHGWFLGLLTLCADRFLIPALGTALSTLIPLLLLASILFGQSAPPRIDADQLLARMEQFSAAQQRELASYQSTRRYAAGNSALHAYAEVTAEMKYNASAEKQFNVVARSGSAQVQKRVIDRAMEAEQNAGSKGERENTNINRRNYSFTFQGFDESMHAYVFAVEPRGRSQYLFRGKVWLDEGDCAIERVEGEPAKSPSFWVKRVHLIHEYRKFGDFWLPVRHESQAELRLFGRSSFIIDYSNYRWQQAEVK